jgi:hypothetical protein
MPLSASPESHFDSGRQPKSIPRMRHHRRSGHGVVRLSGEDFWLGKFGTPESFQRYQHALSEWRARGCISRRKAAQPTPPPPAAPMSTPNTIDIAEIVERYLQHAETEFAHACAVAGRQLKAPQRRHQVGTVNQGEGGLGIT